MSEPPYTTYGAHKFRQAVEGNRCLGCGEIVSPPVNMRHPTLRPVTAADGTPQRPAALRRLADHAVQPLPAPALSRVRPRYFGGPPPRYIHNVEYDSEGELAQINLFMPSRQTSAALFAACRKRTRIVAGSRAPRTAGETCSAATSYRLEPMAGFTQIPAATASRSRPS